MNVTESLEESFGTIGDDTPTGVYTIAVIFAIAAVVGLFGNGSVLAIICIEHFRRRIHVLIACLSTIDIINSVNFVIYSVTMISEKWIFEAVMCELIAALSGITTAMSILTNMLLALNRYFIVRQNTKFRMWMCTLHGTWSSLLFLFTFSFSLLVVPHIVGYVKAGYMPLLGNCVMATTGDPDKLHTWVLYTTILLIGLPNCVAVLCYFKVLWHIRMKVSGQNILTTAQTRYIKLTKILGQICFLYFICYTLPSIYLLSDPMLVARTPIFVMRILNLFLNGLSGCVNPYILLIQLEDYKRGLTQLCQKIWNPRCTSRATVTEVINIQVMNDDTILQNHV